MAGLGRALVVAWRADLQAPSRLPEVDVVLPTAQTVSVTTTPTLAARGVTSLANHGGRVAKVTGKERVISVWFMMFCDEKGEEALRVCRVLLTSLNSFRRSCFPA